MTENGVILWLPKGLYSSVEPMMDQRYIWCPMPLDEAVSPQRASFIHPKNANIPPFLDKANSGCGHSRDSCAPVETKPGLRPPGSEAGSDLDFPFRKISRNVNRGRKARLRRNNFDAENDVSQCGKTPAFSIRVDLNLDIEVALKASVHGDLTMSLLVSLSRLDVLLNAVQLTFISNDNELCYDDE